MISCTAQYPRAPVSGRLARPHRRAVQPSIGRPAGQVGEAESKAAAPQLIRSGLLALGTGQADQGRRLVRHTPPADIVGARTSHSKLQAVKAVGGRKGCVPVCECVRARGIDRGTCMGGHGITAASCAGAPPSEQHSEHSRHHRARYYVRPGSGQERSTCGGCCSRTARSQAGIFCMAGAPVRTVDDRC